MQSNKQLQTREQKLKFLNDLRQGKTSLRPRRLLPFPFPDDNIWLNDDETFKNQGTGEIIGRDEFEKRFDEKDVITFA